MTRAPAISICHGGGPLPVLGDPSHAAITDSLKNKVPKILKLGTAQAPRAIVIVTAHWQTARPTISSGIKHELMYDYGGFVPESYTLKYDAPGSPEVAREVYEVLKDAGLQPELDETREWDHGVFIPMMLINPSARIPIVQVSVLNSENAAELYKMGRALETLRNTNVAIIGSGAASFHNLRLLFGGAAANPQFQKRLHEWSDAVHEAVAQSDTEMRRRKLEGWRQITNTDVMHPKGAGEHFSPLVVIAGAGGQGRPERYVDELMGINMWTYYWN